MRKEDMLMILMIIDELKTNHRLDQIDFVVMMTEAYEGFDSSIAYEFDLLNQRHRITIRDRPEFEIDIIWSNAYEVALEMEFFMDIYKKKGKNVW